MYNAVVYFIYIYWTRKSNVYLTSNSNAEFQFRRIFPVSIIVNVVQIILLNTKPLLWTTYIQRTMKISVSEYLFICLIREYARKLKLPNNWSQSNKKKSDVYTAYFKYLTPAVDVSLFKGMWWSPGLENFSSLYSFICICHLF